MKNKNRISKVLIASFLFVALTGAFVMIQGGKTLSLDQPVCSNNDTCSEKEKCEFEVNEKNWPQRSSYEKDCRNWSSVLEEYKTPLTVIGSILGAAVLWIFAKKVFREGK